MKIGPPDSYAVNKNESVESLVYLSRGSGIPASNKQYPTPVDLMVNTKINTEW